MKDIIKRLEVAILKEDLYQTNNILEEIQNEEDCFQYIRPILEIMENNPEIYYGDPGPIVHFMEKYYNKGYETLLLESIERKPTQHTLWMINRIINDPHLTNKQQYRKVLKSLLTRRDIMPDILTEVERLINKL